MRKTIRSRKLNRRDFMKLGGGVLAGAALTRLLPRTLGQSGLIAKADNYSQVAPAPANLHLVGTDGWIYLPGEVPIPGTINQFYQPDDFAPDLLTTYMFGFRDVTGLSDELVFDQKMKCQATAPLFWVDEGEEYRVKLTNVGLQMRPDLIDEHTLHWHGFRNAWPIFDGEPHSSVRIPIGRSLTMFYQPFHPGTYMYHCHVEETEHVHMGMTGSVFVRPAQDKGGAIQAANGKWYSRFAYNCGDGSTGFDREFVLNLTDVWAEAHWA
ncbi:MAG: multicopper oxidase domain-containing protein, partial [Candidatus Promineifilaceae bacterium]